MKVITWDDTPTPLKAWTDGVPVEPEAIEQLHKVAKMPFIFRWVAALPDVHVGIGATVGSVIATDRAIIPAAVGVDIGCVDRETEFLSPEGWCYIRDWNGEKVAQYDVVSGLAEFVEPIQYVVRPSSGFYAFRTKYGVDQRLSADHRMLVWSYDRDYSFNKHRVVTAREVAEEHASLVNGYRHRILTAPESFYTGTSFPASNEDIRVAVMVAADGHMQAGGICVLSLKKKMKIDRARSLLEEAGIPITKEREADGVTRLTFRPILPKGLSQFWTCSADQLEVISNEVLYWDGNKEDRCFFTRLKDEADFVQYAFLTQGYRAVLRADQNADGSVDYRVFRHINTKVGLNGSPKGDVEFVPSEDGKEYCFQVPSSFFLIRRNGQVAITGNCGMTATLTDLTAADLPDSLSGVRAAIEKAVPHGRTDNGGKNDRGAWGDIPESVAFEWAELSYGWDALREKHPKLDRGATYQHLGTLGSGNHFIEVCLDEQDRVWVLLHSGSRGVGNRIGQFFIETAKKDMEKWFIPLPDKDLAYFPEGTEHFDQYLEAVGWAQRFARTNREVMRIHTLGALQTALGRSVLEERQIISCHHNYVQRERHMGANVLVTRKGAVSAKEGELGIIPGSMGTRSYIVSGLGNRESFMSCSHGAGRRMSRTAARKEITLDAFRDAMEGIEANVGNATLDEAPMAYKGIEEVMAAQRDLVEVVHTLRQVAVVKG